VSAWLSNHFWKGPQPSSWAGQIFPVKTCENSEEGSFQVIYFVQEEKTLVYFQTNYGKKNVKSEKQITVSRNKYRWMHKALKTNCRNQALKYSHSQQAPT
jgi:hypothetical protein